MMFWGRIVALALVVAAVVAGGAGADDMLVRTGTDQLVLIEGCEGFVAEGGVAANYPPHLPQPWSFRRNFLIDYQEVLTFRRPPDRIDWRTDIKLRGAGADASGHTFDVKAKLVQKQFGFGFPEIVGSGTARIKRDDGAVVEGDASEALSVVYSPIFRQHTILRVSATECRLPD